MKWLEYVKLLIADLFTADVEVFVGRVPKEDIPAGVDLYPDIATGVVVVRKADNKFMMWLRLEETLVHGIQVRMLDCTGHYDVGYTMSESIQRMKYISRVAR